MKVLLLDAAQADAVRGPSPTDDAHILAPVALSDGRFILGEPVMHEPAFAHHAAIFDACELVEYDDIAGLVAQDE